MTTAIQRFDQDKETRARAWASLSSDDAKLRVAQAVARRGDPLTPQETATALAVDAIRLDELETRGLLHETEGVYAWPSVCSAGEHLQEAEKVHGSRGLPEHPAHLELWSVAEAYLTTKGRKRGRVSPNTVRNYRRGVLDLLGAWEGENLLHPSRNAGDLYVLHLQGQGLTPGTIRVKLAAARLLYKALRWAGATDAAPFEDVQVDQDSTPPEEKRHPYRQDALDRLLAKASPIDRAVVLLGAHGGLRVSEIVNLCWKDVNLDGSRPTLAIRAGKGQKKRTVRLSPSAVKALEPLRRRAEADDPVFGFDTTQRARQRLQRLCKRALVEYKGAHSLRHYCGTRLYEETGDLHTVAKHLGHSSVETARIYAKWNTERLDQSVGTW